MKQRSQTERIAKAFAKRPATMLMVSRATGIERASVCRYVAALRRAGRIMKIKTDLCKVSKERAGYYSTDETKWPVKQLKFL